MRQTFRDLRSGSNFSFSVRLFLELGIVFFGVYLAFLLNEFRINKELERHQIQLLNGLNKEIEYFLGDDTSGAKMREPGMLKQFEGWQKSVASGEKKVPLYFKMLGNALPTRSMWQVVVYSDGLNLLDVPTTFELSKYYNSFDIMLNKYQKLIDFAEVEIIPFVNKPGFFYQADGQLYPKFNAYVERYADFLNLFKQMIKDSEAIKILLQSEIKRLE